MLVMVVFASAYFDLRTQKVPNKLTYGAIVAGLAVSLILNGTQGLIGSLGGLAIAFIPMFCFWLMGAIGGGDVKLLAAVGALSNWRFIIAVMAASFAVIAVWALLVLIKRRILWLTIKRICRTVFLAAVSVGKSGWPDQSQETRLAFAVAVAIGAALALLDGISGANILRP